MFEITLYSNTSDDAVVDKTITALGSVQGNLIEGGGVLTPTFRIESESVPTFNYARIAALGNRYYFVEGEPVWESHNIWRVSFRHDPLMNLKGQFRNLNAIVERQENAINPYLVDGEAPIEVDTQLFIKKLSGNFSTRNNLVLLSSSAV